MQGASEVEDADEVLLRQLEVRLLSTDVRASSEALAELLADEFVEFGSSGLVWDKVQTVAGLLGEGSGPAVERSARDLRVRLLVEDVALVTYRAVRRGLDDAIEVHTLRSSIWRREGGRWRMVFHQGTRSGPKG